MSRKLATDRTRLRFNGVFDFDGLYTFMRKWFLDRKFIFTEKNYKYKVPTPVGAESEIEWTAWRKINEDIVFHINIYFWFWDLHPVEVIEDGEKKQRYKARFFIDFSGAIEVDWQNRFEGSRFREILGKIFYSKMRKLTNYQGLYWDQLYYLILDYYNDVKNFLGMTGAE